VYGGGDGGADLALTSFAPYFLRSVMERSWLGRDSSAQCA